MLPPVASALFLWLQGHSDADADADDGSVAGTVPGLRCAALCGTALQVDWLSEKMRQANFTVSAMHGDMPQKERDEIMAEFRYVWCTRSER